MDDSSAEQRCGECRTLSEVLETTRRDGGGTWNAVTLHPVRSGGWAVGGSLPGWTVDLEWSPDHITRVFGDACDSLMTDGARYIGTWIDEGMLYVDAIELIDDTDEALRVAAERGEKAIYHLTDKITLGVH
jgi:hypothetical protein